MMRAGVFTCIRAPYFKSWISSCIERLSSPRELSTADGVSADGLAAQSKIEDYSYLSATMGSTLVARRAGR